MAVKIVLGVEQVNTIAVVGVIPTTGAILSAVITTVAVYVQLLAVFVPITVYVPPAVITAAAMLAVYEDGPLHE